MRSGTCRMLKLSTIVFVPFLIYAVMLSLRFLAETSIGGMFFVFLVRLEKLCLLKINDLENILKII
jgi:hypothetical protein